MMTKNLTILGSTGSIGRQTLEVVEQLPVRVAALTAGQNVERMAEQCRRFRPQLAVMGTEEAAQRLREALAGEKILLQGVTDCCLIELDGLVILDFKSDRLRPGAEHERAEYYRGQLDAYSRALSRIFELPVSERIVYFFATDTAVSL